MNFAQAIGQLKNGRRLTRPGWSDDPEAIQFLSGKPCINLTDPSATSDELDDQVARMWAQMALFTFTVGRDDGDPDHNIDREKWPATVEDLEADDWQIVEFTP